MDVVVRDVEPFQLRQGGQDEGMQNLVKDKVKDVIKVITGR